MNDQQEQLNVFRRQAEELLDRRRIAQARQLLGRALEQFPGDHELLLAAGWIEYYDDDIERAVQICATILENNPTSARARYLMAALYEARDDLRSAEDMYASLLRDFPNHAGYMADFALLLLRTVQHDRARIIAEHAISLDPNHARAQRAILGCALLRGDRQRADTMMANLLESDPDAVSTALTLTFLLQERGEVDEALRVARNLLSMQPDNEHIVEAVIELTHKAHWSMYPLRRVEEYYPATVGIGLVGLALVGMENTSPTGQIIGAGLVLFTLYAWVWPPVFKYLVTR